MKERKWERFEAEDRVTSSRAFTKISCKSALPSSTTTYNPYNARRYSITLLRFSNSLRSTYSSLRSRCSRVAGWERESRVSARLSSLLQDLCYLRISTSKPKKIRSSWSTCKVSTQTGWRGNGARRRKDKEALQESSRHPTKTGAPGELKTRKRLQI